MYIFVLTLHIILCTLLVLIILMQPGKGSDPSAAFGGGSATQLFGAAGPGNFLTQGTGLIATLFMVTSVVLALYSTESGQAGTGDLSDDIERLQDEGDAGGGFIAPSGAPTPPAPEVPVAPSLDAPSPGATPAPGTPPAPATPATPDAPGDVAPPSP